MSVKHTALLSRWQGKRLSRIFPLGKRWQLITSLGEASKYQLQTQLCSSYISLRFTGVSFHHYTRGNFELNINSTRTHFLQNSIFEKTVRYFPLYSFPLIFHYAFFPLFITHTFKLPCML